MAGHGHVTPNANGSRMRCGGPGLCAVCSRELSQKLAHDRKGLLVGGPSFTRTDTPAHVATDFFVV